jgi:hypothetical protein
MKVTYHIATAEHTVPKRGNLIQTNIGKKTERTWFILAVREMSPKYCPQMDCVTRRYKLWAERWWELDPHVRMLLWRSAERLGGQQVHPLYRFPPKKKPTLEQYQGTKRSEGGERIPIQPQQVLARRRRMSS